MRARCIEGGGGITDNPDLGGSVGLTDGDGSCGGGSAGCIL